MDLFLLLAPLSASLSPFCLSPFLSLLWLEVLEISSLFLLHLWLQDFPMAAVKSTHMDRDMKAMYIHRCTFLLRFEPWHQQVQLRKEPSSSETLESCSERSQYGARWSNELTVFVPSPQVSKELPHAVRHPGWQVQLPEQGGTGTDSATPHWPLAVLVRKGYRDQIS